MPMRMRLSANMVTTGNRMAHHFEDEALLALLADMAPVQGRTPAQWRRVAYLIALNTHHRQSLDTATRMANRGR
jgi:hypothetical protein